MTTRQSDIQAAFIYEPGQVVTGIASKIEDDAIVLHLPGDIRGIIARNGLPVEYRRKSCRYTFSRGSLIEAEVRVCRQKTMCSSAFAFDECHAILA